MTGVARGGGAPCVFAWPPDCWACAGMISIRSNITQNCIIENQIGMKHSPRWRSVAWRWKGSPSTGLLLSRKFELKTFAISAWSNVAGPRAGRLDRGGTFSPAVEAAVAPRGRSEPSPPSSSSWSSSSSSRWTSTRRCWCRRASRSTSDQGRDPRSTSLTVYRSVSLWWWWWWLPWF